MVATTMSLSRSSMLLLFLLLLLLPSVYCSGAHHHHDHLSLQINGDCRGTVAECMAGGGGEGGEEEDEELEMSSEVSRRILASTSRYISYGALRRDNTPCSRRGASYYNCRPGAQANPYSRGCSAITRCRS